MGQGGNQRRPRIGVDLHTLEGLHQGSRTHCIELFSRASRLLPEADFYFFADTERWDPSIFAMFSASNARVVHMRHVSSPLRLLFQLPRLVQAHSIDVLHTQYISPPILSARTAVTIHDILCEEYPEYFGTLLRIRSRILFRLSAWRSDMVFTVSEYSKQRLEKDYGVPSFKLTTTYNGVDGDRFYPGGEGRARLAELGLTSGDYMLTVGRLEPRKNHTGLLRALALMPAPRPKLVIVGQRDFRFQEIFDLREELHLQDDVLILETVGDDLLPTIYRHARLFVYPTFAEGFGIPVLEAMASGVPVVTSNATSLPEVAAGAAVFVDPKSPQSISDGILSVLNEVNGTEVLREKGLVRARELSWDHSAAVLAERYRTYFQVPIAIPVSEPASPSGAADLPLISVTIVSYNGATDIRRCLSSLQAQTWQHFEVIAVDNASNDDSVAVFREFPWVRLIVNSANAGFSVAQNQTIRESRGEYVVCLNLDTRAEPTFLERLVAAIEIDDRIGSVCPKILHMDQNGAASDPPLIDCVGIYATPDMRHHNRGSKSLDRGQYDQPCYVFGYTGAAAMFRRSTLDDMIVDGAFLDEDFFAFREDGDMSWRMQLAGWHCLYTPYATIYHRRLVFEDNRRYVSPIINLHSTKNRFLLRINNITPRLYRKFIIPMTVRDMGVLLYVLLRERSSLPGLLYVVREWKRLFRKRKLIQSNRKVSEKNIEEWFSYEPVTRPLESHLAAKLAERSRQSTQPC